MTDSENGGRNLENAIFRIADGDRSALADFYRIISGPVYAYSLSRLKNPADAEDIVSELLIEVWRCAPAYKSMGKPMAWVMTVAKNLCLMKLRESSKTAGVPLEDAAAYLKDERGLGPENSAVIRACLEILGETEREIVLLHVLAGLRHREIAKFLGVPLSTVLSRYQRAVKKLNKELEGALR